MTTKRNKQLIEELYEAIVRIETTEEAEKFLDDLCTIKELEAMSQRLKAAKMLLAGKTYQEIVGQTDISSATLARVSRCVQYGDGGYKQVIEKI